MSYLGHTLARFYPSAEVQSVYSTAPATWTIEYWKFKMYCYKMLLKTEFIYESIQYIQNWRLSRRLSRCWIDQMINTARACLFLKLRYCFKISFKYKHPCLHCICQQMMFYIFTTVLFNYGSLAYDITRFELMSRTPVWGGQINCEKLCQTYN